MIYFEIYQIYIIINIMVYLYSFMPFESEYVISHPYKLKFKDWFLLNKLNIHKTLSLSRKYGDVIIYVDKKYINEFDKIVPDGITLKEIDLDKSNVWAISKFHSILNFIEEFNVPFVHLDFDAFLLHDVFKNSKPDIVVAYKEYHEDIASSDLWQFSEGMDAYNTVDLTFGDVASHYVGLYHRTYNCSIVGGKNLNLIKNWCYESIKYPDEYKTILNHNITSIVEQGHLTRILETNEIKPMQMIELNKDLNVSLKNYKEKFFVHDRFFGAELLSNDNPSFLRRKWYETYNKIILKSEKVFYENQS